MVVDVGLATKETGLHVSVSAFVFSLYFPVIILRNLNNNVSAMFC